MDGLSGVASGMAVASLSIQLIDSIGTIRAFIRDVKGAARELQRLVELLDRLSSLLQDVRDVMEKQTSLQGQHFPAPSMTIFNSLQGCEESLRVLEQAIERYKSARSGAGSAMTRLKEDVRFGFKTKDIAEFEMRIEREINQLHAAVGVNMTSILTTTLPALLQNQQTFMTLCSQSIQQPYIASALEHGASGSDKDLVSWSESSGLRPITRQYRLAPSLERVGIYQRFSVRSLQHETRGRNRRGASVEDVISETRDVRIMWKILNFGLQWTRKYPYGGIGVSLTVYPVIKSFTSEHRNLVETASILEIQQKISSGQLHPYVRDVRGQSLSFMAARYHRADIYRLLRQHGSRPGLTEPVFLTTLISSLSKRCETDQTDIFRCLLLEDEASDGLNECAHIGTFYTRLAVGTIEWLWTNAGNTITGIDLMSFRSRLLCTLVVRYCHVVKEDMEGMSDAVTDPIVRLVDAEMRRHLISGGSGLIGSLFIIGSRSIESQRIGNEFIALLKRLGLDFKAFIEIELANMPDGLLNCYASMGSSRRKAVFEYLQDGDSTLRWVWILNPQEHGYLVASEFVSLGADSEHIWVEWPFYTAGAYVAWWKWDRSNEKYNARRARREATKARKERARTGQKRPKSKMPGTWNW